MSVFKSISRSMPASFKRSILSIFVLPHFAYYKYIKKHPLSIRWNSSDVNVFYHTLVEKEYVFPFKINPKFIIDAGANIGLSSLLLTDTYPDAKIVSIEPESKNFDLLKQNIAGTDKITALKKGLWSTGTLLKITNPNQSNWAFITEETDNKEDFDVEAISVDQIMEIYKTDIIDIFKIDIEGTEKEIFSKNTEYWLPRTKLIIMEIHTDECRQVCENNLTENNFQHILSNGENDYYANRRYYTMEEKSFS